MSNPAVDGIILHTGKLDEMVRFYRALGIPLEEESHDGGPLHYACQLGGIHFAIYPGPSGQAPGRRRGGATQVGFQMDSLEATLADARAAGAEILQEPEEVPWGRRAVIADPDGRPVELNQARG